jgi:hypothetical protein
VKRVKLITKEIEGLFKKLGRQGNVDDPIVVAKFFNPTGEGKLESFFSNFFLDKCSPKGYYYLPNLVSTSLKWIHSLSAFHVRMASFKGDVDIFAEESVRA